MEVNRESLLKAIQEEMAEAMEIYCDIHSSPDPDPEPYLSCHCEFVADNLMARLEVRRQIDVTAEVEAFRIELAAAGAGGILTLNRHDLAEVAETVYVKFREVGATEWMTVGGRGRDAQQALDNANKATHRYLVLGHTYEFMSSSGERGKFKLSAPPASRAAHRNATSPDALRPISGPSSGCVTPSSHSTASERV